MVDDDVDYTFVFEMNDDDDVDDVECKDFYVVTMMTAMAESNIDGCVGCGGMENRRRWQYGCNSVGSFRNAHQRVQLDPENG